MSGLRTETGGLRRETVIVPEDVSDLREQVEGFFVNGKLGNVYDPLDEGLIIGDVTSDPAENQRIAAINRLAIARTITKWKAALLALDFGATLRFPRGVVIIDSAPTNGANWIGGAKGWSSHSVVLDAGVWTGQLILNGIVDADGCYIKRIENDPGSVGTLNDSNNSTILIMGKWDGLQIRGKLTLEGFQVDTQAEGMRGTTSGDGMQISFGARNITIDDLRGWKGTNAALCVNLNKRGVLSTSTTPTTGFETREEWQCDNIHAKNLICFNGEHGSACYGGTRTRIDNMTVDQKPYTFGGVTQGTYQQRGLYCLNAQVTLGNMRVNGVNHVALFCAVYDDTRSYTDIDVRVGRLEVNFPRSQDADPDRYAALEMQNANTGVGVLRTISVAIGTMIVNNQKSCAVWRETNRYISVQHQIFKSLTIDHIVGKSILHGIYLKPHGGFGRVSIKGIQIDVRTDLGVSTTVFPGDGVLIQAGGWFNRETTDTYTMAQMNLSPFLYWDGVSATRPEGYIKPGNVKKCSNFPGQSGTVTIIYDPTPRTGANRWGFDTVTGAPWRIMEEPAKGEYVHVQGEVNSECAPLRIGGVIEYDADISANYIEAGVATRPEERVPSTIVGISRFIKNQVRTSVDTAITDPTLARTATLGDIAGRQPSNANLTAVAGLATAADKITYWTGSGLAALADFPAQARTLLAATSQTDQRTALGLQGMATQAPGAVAITGGTATVNGLSLSATSGTANLGINAASGQSASMSLRTDGFETWRFERTSSGTFALRRFDAAGTLTGTNMTSDQSTGITNITSLTSPSILATATGTTPLSVSRTGNAANCSISWLTTAGTIYGGNVDGSTFAVGPSTSLSTTPFFSANATTFRVGATTETTFASVGRPLTDNNVTWGTASFRWSTIYAGTGTINTSDARLKRDIVDIPSELLDAWGSVRWFQFRFIEAYERKGEDARFHHGLVAQQVRDAIDEVLGTGAALRFGLLCYDEWEEKEPVTLPVLAQRPITRQVTETVTVYRIETVVEQVEATTEDGETIIIGIPRKQEVGHIEDVTIDVEDVEEYETGETYVAEPGIEAGDRWGLRMEYCLAVEVAWQRREIERDRDERASLAARIAALEAG